MDKVVLNGSGLDSLFEFLVALDTPSKKKIIKRLQDSLKKKDSKDVVEESPRNKRLRKLAGAWQDDRSTEQILKDIKETVPHSEKAPFE